MARIRTGIIGAGSLATLHAPAHLEDPRVQLVAVCDVDEARAVERALAWGVGRVHTRAQELLDDPQIDAVEILTPNDTHAELTIAAARAGKHVHVAGPLAFGLREADAARRAARDARVVLQVCEPSRFYPAIEKARAMLSRKMIGEPRGLRAQVTVGDPASGAWGWRLDPARAGAGPLIATHAYHQLAIAQHLLGRIERIACLAGRLPIPDGELDAPCVMQWQHRDPLRMGTLQLHHAPDLFAPGHPWPVLQQIELFGTRGVIELGAGYLSAGAAPLRLLRDGQVVAHSELDADWRHAHQAATRHFFSCVQGEAKPRLSGRDAKEALRLTLCAWASAERAGDMIERKTRRQARGSRR